jgi:hypothetical protein
MKNQAVINPQKNSRSIDRHVLFAERLMLGVAVVITSAGFLVWGYNAAGQYTEVFAIKAAFGIMAALMSAMVTDFAFRNFLEEVIFQMLVVFYPKAQNHIEKPGYIKVMAFFRWAILATIVSLLFYADFISVYTVKDPIASAAKQKPVVDPAKVSEQATSAMNAQIKPLKQQIAALKNEIKQEESRVERANASLVKLVSQGNNWAPSQLAAKKASATKSKRANLSKLEDAYNQALSGNSAALATINTQAIQTSQATIEENNTQKAAMSNLFQLFGVGSKIMTILFRMFLVVSFLSKNPNLDANGDGTVDGEDVTAAASGAFR